MKRLVSLAATLLAAGCGADSVWLGFPPASDMASMVVATPSEGGVALDAIDLGSAAVRLDAALDREGERTVHALLFEAPLGAYGLEEGPMPIPDGGPVVPLLGEEGLFGERADRVFAARVYDAQAAVDWESVGAAPAWIADRVVRRPPPKCPTFSPDPSVELNSFPAFVVPLSARRAVVRMYASGTYVIGDGQAVEITPPGPAFTGALQADDGTLWLGDSTGTLWTGRADPTEIYADLESKGTSGRGVPIDSIAARGDDVFFVDYAGDVFRWDNGRISFLGETGTNRIGPIEWTAPGEAAIVAPDPAGIHIVTANGITFEAMTEDGASSIRFVPGIGAVMGTASGRFFVRDGGAWNALDIDGDGWWGAGIMPYDGGFLFHIASGAGGFFHPELDLCSEVFTTGVFVESRLVPQGRDILVSTVTSDAERTVFTLMRRR